MYIVWVGSQGGGLEGRGPFVVYLSLYHEEGRMKDNKLFSFNHIPKPF